MTAGASVTGRGRARGFVLVLVLWIGALLALVVGSLAFSARSEIVVARGAVELAQAEALAEAGVARAIVGLLERDRTARWRADGDAYRFELPGGAVTVRVESERGKVDLNAAPEALVRGLFDAAAGRLEGFDPAAATAVAAAVLDWRDADDAALPQGAEAPAYVAAGLPWEPSNGAFVTVSELRRVIGVTPELYALVAPEVTVHGVGARLDPQTASALALEAVPGADAGLIESFLGARGAWAEEGVGSGPFPAQHLAGLERYLARGASAFYTVRAEGRTVSGRLARCAALVRMTGRPADPAEIIGWETGMLRRGDPSTPDMTAAAAELDG